MDDDQRDEYEEQLKAKDEEIETLKVTNTELHGAISEVKSILKYL